jgi:putative addiction module component (TIGR02574 family)
MQRHGKALQSVAEQSMDVSLEKFGIDELNPTERLELIGLIWDSLGPMNATDIPEWHRRELDRRRAAADANPDAGSPWHEVKERLSRRS